MQVVLTEDEQRWLSWADQFVAADTNNRGRVIFPSASSSRSEALRLIAQAASQAGQSGRVIISVGHGAVTAGGGAAWVDLAPGGTFRLEQALITNVQRRESDETLIQNVTTMAGGTPPTDFCEQLLNPPGSRSRIPPTEPTDPIAVLRCRGFPAATSRTDFRRDYTRFGEILHQNHVAEVMFLACSIGTASAFMSRIASDWSVSVQAYRERIVADADGDGGKTRVYREGHRPQPGTPNSLRTETELPRGHVTESP